MKEAPHEKMTQDEIEYATRAASAYAVCCSQRELEDETELRGAFFAGFKSACAYLRSPGISRAEIVGEPSSVTPGLVEPRTLLNPRAQSVSELMSAIARFVTANPFDDDSDPALDTPTQRVVRAFWRWKALST